MKRVNLNNIFISTSILLLNASCQESPVVESEVFNESGDTVSFFNENVCDSAGHPDNRKFCWHMATHHTDVRNNAYEQYTSAGFTGGYCAATQAMGLQESGVVAFAGELPMSTIKLEHALIHGGSAYGGYWGHPKGWHNVECEELKAGDIVLTTPVSDGEMGLPRNRQIPAHSFMFVKWVSLKNVAKLKAEGKLSNKKYKWLIQNEGQTGSGVSQYLAWGLDYSNYWKSNFENKAYIRWMRPLPLNGNFTGISNVKGKRRIVGGDNLCSRGIRSFRGR